MTPDEVRARLLMISEMSWDAEIAHTAEDELRADVLTEIANGADNAPELARLALKTSGIKFARWCA